jgi:hypothetical protein
MSGGKPAIGDDLKSDREPVRTKPPSSSADRSFSVALLLLGISIVFWVLIVALGDFGDSRGDKIARF